MIKNKEFKPVMKEGGKLLVRVRVSYAHLDEPWAGNDNSEKKYSISCIIPKDDKESLQAVEKAIDEAKKEGKAKKWGGVIPKKLQLPLRDGDEEREEDEAYSDCLFFSASSKQPVKTFNRGGEVCEPSEIYSGCWAIASLKFYPYDASGNKGVAVGLNQVLKWADDEALGGNNNGNDFEGLDGLDVEGEDLEDL